MGAAQVNQYIFDENHPNRELLRLQRIESALDADSHRLLLKAGLSVGCSCLEVGAGGGSILRWLGERVGSNGKAVGVDKNVAHLRRLTSEHEIVEGDVLDLPGSAIFDLIHCRYVLIHNRTASTILGHLKNLLKPGGRLVAEEPDFESAEWIDDRYKTAGERVNRAICSMFSGMSLDPGYGKRMPESIAHLGLAVKYAETITHLEPGGGPVALMMADSTEALREKYVATAQAHGEDVDQYIDGSRDPKSWAIYYSTVRVIAAKPLLEAAP
jgi:ubiquinone/menaquinone biosynthesis C-methylase UbiE